MKLSWQKNWEENIIQLGISLPVFFENIHREMLLRSHIPRLHEKYVCIVFYHLASTDVLLLFIFSVQ